MGGYEAEKQAGSAFAKALSFKSSKINFPCPWPSISIKIFSASLSSLLTRAGNI
jgi:ABC-type Co2+ transport system permease subunit